MAEADHLKAALPDRFIILGQLLRPFSLGHMMILRRMENAFVLPHIPPGLNDLVQGVFICRETFEGALEALQDPRLPKILKKWGKAAGEFDHVEKIAAFSRYVANGATVPEVWEDESREVKQFGSPFLQRLALVLQSKLGHSVSSAMNYPYGAAIHDYFGFFELEERIRLVSEEDTEIAKRHETLMQEYASKIDELEKKGLEGGL